MLGGIGRIGRIGRTLSKGGGFTTEGLFGPSNNGFYYDFSKTDGLFVLPGGPTNVAVDTDPLGLVLDRRLWGGKTLSQIEAAAAELTTDEDWTLGTSATRDGGEITQPSGTSSYSYQVFATTAGRLYRVDFRVTSGAFFAGVWSAAPNSTVLAGAATYFSGTHALYFLANDGDASFSFTANVGTGVIDSIVVWHIPGNHATSSGSTRPFWYDEGLGRGDAIDDTELTTFTPAAAGNTFMARVTVPASLSGTQYIGGVYSPGPNSRILLGFTLAGLPIFGAGVIGTETYAVDYRGQTMTIAITENGNGSPCLLYANGAQVDSAAFTGSVPTTLPYRIFSANNNGSASNFFGGDIYKVMAINRALTPTEILRTHNLWSS